MTGAAPTDWVAYQVTSGSIGRRKVQALTGLGDVSGPMTGPTGIDQELSYTMPDLPYPASPATQITMQALSATPLAAPAATAVQGGFNITLGGVAEVPAGTATNITLQLYFRQQNNGGVESLAEDSINNAPAGSWAGLLVQYSDTFLLADTALNGTNDHALKYGSDVNFIAGGSNLRVFQQHASDISPDSTLGPI